MARDDDLIHGKTKKEIMMNPNSPESKTFVEFFGIKKYNKMRESGMSTEEVIEDRLKRSGNKKIKKAPGDAVHKMPDGTLMKGAKHGMKHGGSVKGKCKVDGIAIRGRTKAKHK